MGEDPEAGPVFIGSANRFGYGSGNPEGRDHRSDQDHGDPSTGVPAEGKDAGPVQGDAGREGGRAPGADLQGRGIHRVDPEGRDPDHVPAVLHRRAYLGAGGQADESGISEKEDFLHRGQLPDAGEKIF